MGGGGEVDVGAGGDEWDGGDGAAVVCVCWLCGSVGVAGTPVAGGVCVDASVAMLAVVVLEGEAYADEGNGEQQADESADGEWQQQQWCE